MRKEVKLGMVIGGGLVALLVAYLLVAPPNQTKKGAAFAQGDGGAQSGVGDGGQAGDPPADDSTNARNLVSAPYDAASGQTGTPGGAPPAQTKTGGVTEHKTDAPVAGKSGTAGPTAGNNGATGGTSGVGSPAGGSADWNRKLTQGGGGPVVSGKTGTGRVVEERPETDDRRATGGVATGGVETGGVATGGRRAMYIDPNAAWGDGVSADGPPLAAIRSAGKSRLVSGGSAGPAVVTPTAAIGAARTHAVQQGETLSSIAAAAYGSASAYTHIVKANPGINPNALKIGTVLTLPAIDQVKAATAAERKTSASAAPAGAMDVRIDPTRQYKVVSGDSLYKIAAKLYGKGTVADKIYDRNKALIGPDARRLKLGMVLDLPEAPLVGLPAAANTPALASPARDAGSNLENGEAK